MEVPEKAVDELAHWLYSRWAKRPDSGVESIDGYWPEISPMKRQHWRRLAQEMIEQSVLPHILDAFREEVGSEEFALAYLNAYREKNFVEPSLWSKDVQRCLKKALSTLGDSDG